MNILFNPKIIRKKTKETNLEKYGVISPIQNDLIKEKIKNSTLEKYGVENIFKDAEYMKKKMKEKYGVEYYQQTDEFKKRIPEINQKIYLTRKKNKTLSSSKPEEIIFNLLIKKYPNTKRQYKCERYPFACDFYIPELDLFIEFNGFWVHNKEPFNKENPEHIKIVEFWKSKNTKFYNSAIETWTIRDCLKIKTAKKNNLNYKIFYTLSAFKKFYDLI